MGDDKSEAKHCDVILQLGGESRAKNDTQGEGIGRG